MRNRKAIPINLKASDGKKHNVFNNSRQQTQKMTFQKI